jgi:hypothetical protein
MKSLAGKFWNDELGAVVTAEMVLVGTVAVLGLVVGLNAVQSSLVYELTDISQAFSSLNQSYYLSGFRGCKSWSSGSGCVSAGWRNRVCGYAFNDGEYYDAPDASIGVGQREVVYYHTAEPTTVVCPPEGAVCPPAEAACPPATNAAPGALRMQNENCPPATEQKAPQMTLPTAPMEFAPISPPAGAFLRLRPGDLN